jgi:hypothetical protein
MKTKLFILAGACLLLGLESLTAQVTYRVYATRIGLVGQTTANGHVIQSRDHFVALPSRTVLNSRGGSTYTVTIRNPANGKVASNVPVWDIGPWNCDDNYWSSNRSSIIQPPLPRGLPQAQAAFQDGHNGGRDFSSSCGPGRTNRTVLNPAGIDLADGTFWDALGMSNNGWVDVTFNWETSTPTTGGIIVDNMQPGFSASANWFTTTSVPGYWGSNYHARATASVSDPATWNLQVRTLGDYEVFAWWTAGSNRATAAPYIIDHNGGSTVVHVDQTKNGGRWVSLGTYRFGAANPKNHSIRLSCWTSSGQYVIGDAVRLVPKVVWVDNHHSGFTASNNWNTSTSGTQKFGPDFRWRNTQAISDAATWTAHDFVAGSYQVQAWWVSGSNRATAAPYIVHRSGGTSTVTANQTINGGQWRTLGTFNLPAGENKVQLSCWTSSGNIVVADAIRWRLQ